MLGPRASPLEDRQSHIRAGSQLNHESREADQAGEADGNDDQEDFAHLRLALRDPGAEQILRACLGPSPAARRSSAHIKQGRKEGACPYRESKGSGKATLPSQERSGTIVCMVMTFCIGMQG
ncbi:MAG TPA: hypothetical protein VGL45_21210 [Bradyrhizobium sp.]